MLVSTAAAAQVGYLPTQQPVSRPRARAGAHAHRGQFHGHRDPADVGAAGRAPRRRALRVARRRPGASHRRIDAHRRRIRDSINPFVAGAGARPRHDEPAAVLGERRTRAEPHGRARAGTTSFPSSSAGSASSPISARRPTLAGSSSAPALHSTGAAEFAGFRAARGRCAATSRTSSTRSRTPRRSTSHRPAARRWFRRRKHEVVLDEQSSIHPRHVAVVLAAVGAPAPRVTAEPGEPMARDFEDMNDLDDLSDGELRGLVREHLAAHNALDIDDLTVEVARRQGDSRGPRRHRRRAPRRRAHRHRRARHPRISATTSSSTRRVARRARRRSTRASSTTTSARACCSAIVRCR